MKYANLIWPGTVAEKNGALKLNLGDVLQFQAIEYFLIQNGVPKEDIIYLRMDEISTYRGEKVTLLLNWALFDTNFMLDDKFNISPDIRMMYVAATINSVMFKESYFNEYNINYLKEIEPIGCRDIRTYEVLKTYGIKAYVNGCMTSLLPKRQDDKRKKILLIDVPIEVREYIPREFYNDFEVMSQQIYLEGDQVNDASSIWKEVENHYKKIKDDAALVITSRLHVASPCVAWGIPVILVKKEMDYRFDWLEYLIPLYSQTEYGKIDWYPKIVDYEMYKDEKIKQIYSYINGNDVEEENVLMFPMLNEHIEGRIWTDFQKCLHGNFIPVIDKVKGENQSKIKTYSIWGITGKANEFCEYMEKEFPDIELRNVYDKFRNGNWKEKPIKRPTEKEIRDDDLIIVLSVGAVAEAKKMFRELEKTADSYCFIGDCFIDQYDIQQNR